MFLVLLALVAAAGLAVAGLLGVGLLSADRRGRRTGLAAALSAPVVLVGALAFTALVVVGVGLGGGGQTSPPPSGPAGPVGPDRSSGPVEPDVLAGPQAGPQGQLDDGAPVPPGRVGDPLAGLPSVALVVSDEATFAAVPGVGGLSPGGAVRVAISGFEWHERAVAELCVVEVGRARACAGWLPVQADGDGRAEILFAVPGNVTVGGCRAGRPTCLIRARSLESDREAVAQVVLVDPFVPGTVRVTPARGVVDGQSVEVAVSGFPPGTSARALLCGPPGGYDGERCQALGMGASLTIDERGQGRTALAVSAGSLCGPRRPCAVSVVVNDGYLAAPAVPISFARGPGVDYRSGRVATGLGVALALLALALVVAWRTDWAKPSEAATPDMDAADLRADQSLDDLFGSDAELDQRDPVPW